MRIEVIFGSQRDNGTHSKIQNRFEQIETSHDINYIEMSEMKIGACTACEGCTHTGKCVLPGGEHDQFNTVFNRLIEADGIFVITPIYAPYPSRLTALMERLLSISFFSHEIGKLEKPLLGKKAAIICYDSGKIGDETQLKLIFQRFCYE